MKIETKFNIFDTVYFMKDNKIKEAEISEININVEIDFYMCENEGKPKVSYNIRDGKTDIEDFGPLFKTKEELLASL